MLCFQFRLLEPPETSRRENSNNPFCVLATANQRMIGYLNGTVKLCIAVSVSVSEQKVKERHEKGHRIILGSICIIRL